MKFNSISYSNIDKIYKAIAIGKRGTDYNKSLERNTVNLFNHCNISLDISEISILEAYVLKLFCDNNLIVLETKLDTDVISDEKFHDMKESTERLYNVMESINDDSDIINKPNTLLFPNYCIQKRVIATFTGNSLSNIFSALPDSFFKKAFNINSDEEFTLDMPIDKEKFDNCVIETFYTNFYRFMSERYNYIDLLVDSTINDEYYKYADKETSVTLSHVNTPYGCLHFLGDDAQHLSDEIQDCLKTFINIPNNKDSFRNTYLFYEISCNFYSFLEMILYLNNRFFVDHEDIKILLSSTDLFIPKIPEYIARLNNRVFELVRLRDEISLDEKYKLEKYNFILLNTKITFTMKLSLDNISNEICLYEKDIIENKLYGDTNQLLVLEILKLIEDIKNNSKIIYKLLTQ